MSMTSSTAGAYKKVNVETASQGKLIVMLFNSAIVRAREAQQQLNMGTRSDAHKNLLHAQEILGELRAALNMKAGDISTNLDRIYEYLQHLLITANIRKDPKPLEECITGMIEMRDTWDEAFKRLAQEGQPSGGMPAQTQHGAAMLNLTG